MADLTWSYFIWREGEPNGLPGDQELIESTLNGLGFKCDLSDVDVY